ncbi:MAG TPA: hypothetical protein DCP61_02365 [Treponema sp.]|nr:hypothetical protein [Treponema sp.]
MNIHQKKIFVQTQCNNASSKKMRIGKGLGALKKIFLLTLHNHSSLGGSPLTRVGLSGVPPFGSIASATASPPLQSLTGFLQKRHLVKERHSFSCSHAELVSASVDVKPQSRG